MRFLLIPLLNPKPATGKENCSDLSKLVDLEMFIQSAPSTRYGIVLIDACRDNPLVKYFQIGKYKGANAKKELGGVSDTNKWINDYWVCYKLRRDS